MTTYTLAQTATRTLKRLGLVGADETPSSVDQADAEESVSAVVATLSAINMPIWNGSDLSVPIEYLEPLTHRVGLSIAPAYGLMDAATAQMSFREAERDLALLAAPRGASPLTMRTSDATGSRKSSRNGLFNFTSGR